MMQVVLSSDKFVLLSRAAHVEPVVSALCQISLGAQNFEFNRSLILSRRASASFRNVACWVQPPHYWNLEAWGETEAECADAVARYLTAFPREHWGTFFTKPEKNALGWSAHGDRWQKEDWI